LRQVARAGRSAARFDFDDICGPPLGPADYFALAQAFRTVLITNVPDFSLQVRPAHALPALALEKA
jgi:predicted ATPase